MPEPTRRTAYVVDDHAVVRDGVRSALEATGDIEVVGEADNVNDGIAGLLATRPDIAIVDVRLPGGDGVEMVREARSHQIGTKFLMFTHFRQADAFYHAVMAGADGFLVKDAPRSRVVAAVRRILAGEKLLDLDQVEPGPASEEPLAVSMAELTEREQTILTLIADGRTNREIAAELFLAEKTVRNYVSSLLSKLGMRNRTEVATYVVRLTMRQQAARRLAS